MDKKRRRLIFAGILFLLMTAWQYFTAPLDNTIVTETGVNCFLILCVLYSLRWYAALFATVTPVLVKLLGAGPEWWMIPFLIAANLVYVGIIRLADIMDESTGQPTKLDEFFGTVPASVYYRPSLLAIYFSTAAKSFAIVLFVAKIAVPVVLKLPAPKPPALGTVYMFPQLVAGGVAGLMVKGWSFLIKNYHDRLFRNGDGLK